MIKITIVDYGLGNHQSLKKILKKIGYKSIISNEKIDILNSDVIILPGVGSFDIGMKNINDFGLKDSLDEAVLEKNTPTIGICLGAQLLLESSDEGSEKGLSYIKGSVNSFKKKFQKMNIDLPIPNMGWRYVKFRQNDYNERMRYYFVHSYHFDLYNKSYVTATSNYGFEFECAFRYKNLTGFQFHPEKSHHFGIKLLSNYFNEF